MTSSWISLADIRAPVTLQLSLPGGIRAGIGHCTIHPFGNLDTGVAEFPLHNNTVVRIATVQQCGDDMSHQMGRELYAKCFSDRPT
jgi:hypothetical protein